MQISLEIEIDHGCRQKEHQHGQHIIDGSCQLGMFGPFVMHRLFFYKTLNRFENFNWCHKHYRIRFI